MSRLLPNLRAYVCRPLLLGACLAAFLVFVPAFAGAQCVSTVDGSGTAQFVLYAGQDINAGTVSVRVDQRTLSVTYNTVGGWSLSQAHLWVGASMDDLPETKTGNPIPGQFPHRAVNLNGATSYTFTIPLSNPAIRFSCPNAATVYYFAAHAALQRSNADGTLQTETGWADGSRITAKGSWATFSTFTLTCICGIAQTNGVAACETAFARDAGANISFLDLGFQRWGWTNGPYTAGSYVLDLWAGAGQSDIRRGYLAGTVRVDYNGSTATVTYTMNSGWWLTETHLYVGAARLPKVKQGPKLVETVAPGQYPYQHPLDAATSDTYAVSASGPIYVVAHAIACQLR